MKISPYQRKKVKVKAIVSLICGEVWSVTDCYCAHQAMQTHSFIKYAKKKPKATNIDSVRLNQLGSLY